MVFFQPDSKSMKLVDIVRSESVVKETLRCVPHTYEKMPSHLTVVGEEDCKLTNGFAFQLTITLVGVVPYAGALMDAVKGNKDMKETVELWLRSCDPDGLMSKADASPEGEILTPIIDGLGSLSLKRGEHFDFRVQ